MIYSTERKLNLSGWLKKNDEATYNSPLKLQKFLLFYELLSKVNGEEVELDHLRGYKKGPVFSNVWGDYTKDRQEFNSKCIEVNDKNNNSLNQEHLKLSHFIVSILNEKELSDLTHVLNLWNSKKDRIENGEQQVPLHESDFNSDDVKVIKSLEKMYPQSLIENISIIPISNYNFIISKDDYSKLSEEHMDILSILAEERKLNNPVYLEIDEEGILTID